LNKHQKGNLILFPRTVEYYQVQLTRMLESEKYMEAIDLLEFLLECQADDERVRKEWEALLEWLKLQFVNDQGNDFESGPSKENEFLEQVIHDRLNSNSEYKNKLLDMLFQSSSFEKQLIALEQLGYVTDPDVTDVLKSWLEKQDDLHPMLQFKALQVLKQQGAKGHIHMYRNGERRELTIEDTPLSLNEFPPHIIQVLDLVKEQSEIVLPNLSYFAEQTWQEFLTYIYGTEPYEILVGHARDHIHVCAAALHYVSVEVMTGPTEPGPILSQYGVVDDQVFMWEKFVHMLKNFVTEAFRSDKGK
jgi:hypothetical protein